MEMDRMDMKVCKARNSRDEIARKEGWKAKDDNTDINFTTLLMISLITIHRMIDTIILSLLRQ